MENLSTVGWVGKVHSNTLWSRILGRNDKFKHTAEGIHNVVQFFMLTIFCSSDSAHAHAHDDDDDGGDGDGECNEDDDYYDDYSDDVVGMLTSVSSPQLPIINPSLSLSHRPNCNGTVLHCFAMY